MPSKATSVELPRPNRPNVLYLKPPPVSNVLLHSYLILNGSSDAKQCCYDWINKESEFKIEGSNSYKVSSVHFHRIW